LLASLHETPNVLEKTMNKPMTAPEIRQLIVRVQKLRDLRGVEVALAQTDAGTVKAREALRAALALREEVRRRPTYAVQAVRSERARMGLPVGKSKRRAYATSVEREALDEIYVIRSYAHLALKKRRIAAVSRDLLPAYEQCGYRVSQSSWAGGDHVVKVELGPTPQASGHTDKVWSANGKWTGTSSTHTLTVRRDYGDRVPADLRAVDGLLTLDLESEIEPGIRPAVWAEQGRGFALNTVRGYLVTTSDGAVVHAESMEAARKLRTRSARDRKDLGDLDAAGLLKRARLHGNERVTMDMAYAGGNGVCYAGMRDWLAKRGVDWTNTPSLTTRQIAEMAVSSGDRIEDVYRVLLIVARVQRAAKAHGEAMPSVAA
jgi:hypothetical protein